MADGRLDNRLVHHAVLVYCHGLLGTLSGAECAGLADAGGFPGVDDFRLIALAGYCGELPNVLLNTRWYNNSPNNPLYIYGQLSNVDFAFGSHYCLPPWPRLEMLPLPRAARP